MPPFSTSQPRRQPAPSNRAAVGPRQRPFTVVMTIGNQKFGIPRKYQYQIGIWYLSPNFLGIFLLFLRNLAYDLLKIWLIIGIFRQNKSRFGIWFPLLLSLVSVWFWFVIFPKVASLVHGLCQTAPTDTTGKSQRDLGRVLSRPNVPKSPGATRLVVLSHFARRE